MNRALSLCLCLFVTLAHSAWAESNSKLIEARRLIVNGLENDRATAENLVIDTIRENPKNADAFAELTRIRLWQIAAGDVSTADVYKISDMALHVRELAPERPLGELLVCEILLAAGHKLQAQKIYAKVKSKYANNVDVLTFESRYLSKSEPKKAIEAAILAHQAGISLDQLSPALIEAMTSLSKSSLELGQMLWNFSQVYPDRWLQHRAGVAFADAGKYPEAERALKASYAMGNILEAQLQLGILYYSRMHTPQNAVAQLEQLIRKIPSENRQSLALARAHLSIAYLEAGNIPQSKGVAEKLTKDFSEYRQIIEGMYEEFKTRKQDFLLAKAFEYLQLTNPAWEFSSIALAEIDSKNKNYAGAIEHFNTAIALSPKRDDLVSYRAYAYYQAADYDHALQDFEAAINLRPEVASHHYNRACMLAKLNRFGDAVESLRAAIELNGDYAETAQNDADLKDLRASEFMNALSDIGISKVSDSGDDQDETDL